MRENVLEYQKRDAVTCLEKKNDNQSFVAVLSSHQVPIRTIILMDIIRAIRIYMLPIHDRAPLSAM